MHKTATHILPFIIVLALLMLEADNILAQSLTGVTGLVTIPTADMPEDGEILFGANWLHKEYFDYGKNEYNGMVNYISLGYLPFAEISLRLTRMLDSPKPQAIGDRMISVRLRPLKQTRYLPAVVLGVHDFAWSVPGHPNNNFNALYIVSSKSFQFNSLIDSIQFHIGYGADWLEALDREFVGLFGGISVSPVSFVTLMFEHDTEKPNCGMRISILNSVDLLFALLNFKTFSGGLDCRFRL